MHMCRYIVVVFMKNLEATKQSEWEILLQQYYNTWRAGVDTVYNFHIDNRQLFWIFCKHTVRIYQHENNANNKLL